ncbi:MAG TPA: sigma-70 family RNA polymerase sigma factor [Longimicrobiales bacterium]
MPASREKASGATPPGHEAALAPLVPLVYDELRRIARRHLGAERPDHTLSTTALVHEAYMKLADQTRGRWRERSHFCAVASRAMRRILVDHARQHNARKRGGARRQIPLGDVALTIDERAEVLIDLDDALTRLAACDERQARIVECRFFAGMTEDETAEALGVSPRTVRREWVKARGWLLRELQDVSA